VATDTLLLASATEDPDQFRLLVACVRDYAIFRLDPRGHIVTWNLGAERIKGYAASDIVGKHFSVFYPAEDIAAGKPDWELTVAAQDGRFEDEGWRIRKDGSRFWANVVITALRDADGILRGYGKVTRDLTARREAEETARRLAAEQAARAVSEKAERYQRHLIAVLGHDLRNCLSVIVAAAEMNRLQAPDEKVRRRATHVVNSAKRMRHIIHSVIDYTYAERDGMVPIVARDGADMHSVCERVLQEFRFLNPDREIAYEAEGNPLGKWDEGRLEEVLQNLISNALKYGAARSPVRVSWRRSSEDAAADLVLTVHNEGPPIAPELLPVVFEPFRSTEQHDRSGTGSMGLGLFIVREIVRAHHGEVSVDSDAEHGTTFTVKLPARLPGQGSATAFGAS
jgi:PAS domain S-box-containing protein